MMDDLLAPNGQITKEILGDFSGDTDPIFNPNDASPYRCAVCGIGLYYGGKGRPPTRCADHKKGSATASGGKRQAPNLKALEDSLTQLYMGLGFGITMVNSDDGMVVVNHAEKLAASWMPLAASNAKVRKFLQKLTTGTGAGAVVTAHAMVCVAIAANHNLDVVTLMKKALGIKDHA